ncbi:MAG: hypothetical protein KJ061_11300 [Vicinamibacteraceae bacterium]|nr:hypothetical protein [Vicinamibacteraceae bacterium]
MPDELKAQMPDWGHFRIWRVGDPAPWWRLLEKFEVNQLRELAALQLDHQIKAMKLEMEHLEAMKKFVAR